MFQLDTKGEPQWMPNFSEVWTSNKSGNFGYSNSIFTYFFHLIIAISIRFCQKAKYLNSCQLCATIIWNCSDSRIIGGVRLTIELEVLFQRIKNHWRKNYFLWTEYEPTARNCTHMIDALKANTCYFQSKKSSQISSWKSSDRRLVIIHEGLDSRCIEFIVPMTPQIPKLKMLNRSVS